MGYEDTEHLKELESYYTRTYAVSGKGIRMAPNKYGYRIGEHPEDDEDYSDIWDTREPNRIVGRKIKKKAHKPDEWDTGNSDFASYTRRVKSDIDAKYEATKAKRLKQANAFTSSMESQTKFTNSLLNTMPSFKQKAAEKKRKKRKKMAKRNISIGGGIFWVFMLYMCVFDDDDADKTAKVTASKEISEITERVRETVENLKPEAQALYDKVSGEVDKMKAKRITTTATALDNADDPYAQDDSKYGDTEDKW